ncbi:hypothetical protein LTR84_008785 [Exophiala bonariae]|uniref:Alpha/beta hydrolase fold-3 domain-containing protein n=1 Tax=Exophiala bonariae TaxID=1690606 RepID=A0AAV9MWP6_9EURO|nr:hypothetical protein LTR84_008785 [Exophiala bonariae]
MAGFNPDDMSRFDDFNIFTTSYKQIGSYNISLNTIYEQGLTSVSTSSQPIIIRFHGGGLVAADSLFPDFFGYWLLDLAKKYGAIIISANHRLLPEANISDILEDLEDVWTWVQSSLPEFLRIKSQGKVRCDLKQILTAGESAGGYLAIQLALNHPNGIRTFLAQYPMVDMKSRWFTESFEKSVLGVPQMPKSVIGNHLAKARDGASTTKDEKIVESSDPRLDRGGLMFCMIQNGLYQDYFDIDDAKQFPIDRLENGERLPPAGGLIWHGEKDSVVPVDGSLRFKNTVRKHNPDINLRLLVRPGDHGFDSSARLTDEWVERALEPYVAAWLA